MLEMNKVMLIGNLTRDPQLSYLASGTALAKLGVGVNRKYKGRDGQDQDETAFVDVDAWGEKAEKCGQRLRKGGRVYIEGRLRFSSWETKGGEKRSKLSVTAERIQPIANGAPTGQTAPGEAPPASAPAPSGPPASAAAPPPHREPVPADVADDLPF